MATSTSLLPIPQPPPAGAPREDFERFVIISLTTANANQHRLHEEIARQGAQLATLAQTEERLKTLETQKSTAIKIGAAVAAVLTGGINLAVSFFKGS